MRKTAVSSTAAIYLRIKDGEMLAAYIFDWALKNISLNLQKIFPEAIIL